MECGETPTGLDVDCCKSLAAIGRLGGGAARWFQYVCGVLQGPTSTFVYRTLRTQATNQRSVDGRRAQIQSVCSHLYAYHVHLHGMASEQAPRRVARCYLLPLLLSMVTQIDTQ